MAKEQRSGAIIKCVHSAQEQRDTRRHSENEICRLCYEREKERNVQRD